MEFAKFGETYYVRMDKGDEIVSSLLGLCQREKIGSAIFSGIGGCSEAVLATFDPVRGEFDDRRFEGVLELISMNGSITTDGGEPYHHTHAAIAFDKDGESFVRGGHVRSLTVLYTGEIELRPVVGGAIGRKPDPETGTYFWSFD